MKSIKKIYIIRILAFTSFLLVIAWWYFTPSQIDRKKFIEEKKQAYFNEHFLKQISFPRKYDGQPSLQAPPEKRDKIIEVHSRFWHNYTQIDQVSFQYSSHTYQNDKLVKTNWNMDARIVMRYGYGIEMEGTDDDENGKHFREVFNRDVGLESTREQKRRVSSMVLSMFDSYRALPEVCSYFSDIQENVVKEGSTQNNTYDILYSRCTSEEPPFKKYYTKYWFNRKTGMLEIFEWCEPDYKKKYGSYAHVNYSYTQCDGIYLPTEIINVNPKTNYKTVQKYSDFKIKKIVVD
jgi:hypothetical protein